MSNSKNLHRRKFLKTGAATVAATTLGAPLIAQDLEKSGSTDANISGFRTQNWQSHFASTQGGAILVDMPSFALHYWNSDRSVYRLYPIAIPLKQEFARLGVTSIVRKREGPSWSPTQSMLQRDPSLPSYVPPGPENPLGTHALYLGWQYYLIHGNNDQRKIGRTASSGCIGLYNEHIEELFGLTSVGCQVKMI